MSLSLAFSVTLFCTTAFFALIVMMLRRSPRVGGELGGPKTYKVCTSLLFVALWLFYVLMSSLEAYGYIEGTLFAYLFYKRVSLTTLSFIMIQASKPRMCPIVAPIPHQ